MKKDFMLEIEESLEDSIVNFNDLNELEELVTPLCDGGGCSCTGGAGC